MIDYHIHTRHSVDADGSLAEYCEKAIKLGLTEVCFTNHCELDPKRNDNLIRLDGSILPISRTNLSVLNDEIEEARARYGKSGLAVRSGLEIGFYNGVASRIHEVVGDLIFDYIIAGIHCLEHVCIDSSKEYRDYFEVNEIDTLLEKYYAEAEHLVDCQIFDSFAHIDVYKKYGIGFYGEKIKRFPEERLRAVLRKMTEKGLALEINTAGLRRVNEFYPSGDIMRLAKECGIERLSIGSDCHKIEDLGKGIMDGMAFARSFGFETLCRFEKRKSHYIKI